MSSTGSTPAAALGSPTEEAREITAQEAQRPSLRRRSARERWLAWVVPVMLLLVWEGVTRAGWMSRLFFPAPSEVLHTLFGLMASGTLPGHIVISLQRLVAGFCLGAIPGVSLGLAMGWSRPVRVLLDPVLSALYPVPRIALLPLIMLIFGIGEVSNIVMIAIGVFFPVLINSIAGVRGIPEGFFEVARSYGAPPWLILRRVVLPGSLPTVFAGLRLASGLALLLVIGVEFLAARKGVGAFLWLGWQTLRTTHIYAALVVTALLGVALSWLVRQAESKLLPWAEGLLHQ